MLQAARGTVDGSVRMMAHSALSSTETGHAEHPTGLRSAAFAPFKEPRRSQQQSPVLEVLCIAHDEWVIAVTSTAAIWDSLGKFPAGRLPAGKLMPWLLMHTHVGTRLARKQRPHGRQRSGKRCSRSALTRHHHSQPLGLRRRSTPCACSCFYLGFLHFLLY